MPTVYAAGTPNSDGYLQGLSAPTTSALLSQIRDVLVQAGCTVDSSQIAANPPFLRVTCNDNGDLCYTTWRVDNVSGSHKRLIIIGDLLGTNQAGNLSSTFEIPFYEGAGSRLYLSTDQAGGVVFILNGELDSRSIHYGFLDRNTNNPTMWMVGMLDVWLDSAQIATDLIGNKWIKMHAYYATAESKTSPTGPYQLVWDSMSIAATRTASTSYNPTSTLGNLAYKLWLGAVDSVTGKPNLGVYGYFIGNTSMNTGYTVPGQGTSSETAVALHFPGPVRFARTGFASVAAGKQYLSKSGQKFISGGGKEYQGFAISA
ncbi:MAG: hypothetical protein ACRC2S_28505 [Waterburya sp.]